MFCQLKTAFLLTEEFESIEMAIIDEGTDVFKQFDNERLPKGWTLTGHSINGASGWVLEFDIDSETPPRQIDFDAVEKYIKEFEETVVVMVECLECDATVSHRNYSDDYHICGDCYEAHLLAGHAMKI